MGSWWFSIEQHCNGGRPPGTRPSAEESLPSAMKAIVEAFGSKTNVLRNYCYIQLQCFHSRGNFLSKTSEEISFQSILFLYVLILMILRRARRLLQMILMQPTRLAGDSSWTLWHVLSWPSSIQCVSKMLSEFCKSSLRLKVLSF